MRKLHGAPMQWAAIFHKYDVSMTHGVENLRFAKAVLWGDIDDDRYPDRDRDGVSERPRIIGLDVGPIGDRATYLATDARLAAAEGLAGMRLVFDCRRAVSGPSLDDEILRCNRLGSNRCREHHDSPVNSHHASPARQDFFLLLLASVT